MIYADPTRRHQQTNPQLNAHDVLLNTLVTSVLPLWQVRIFWSAFKYKTQQHWCLRAVYFIPRLLCSAPYCLKCLRVWTTASNSLDGSCLIQRGMGILHGKRSVYRQLCVPRNSRFGERGGGAVPQKFALPKISAFAFASFMKMCQQRVTLDSLWLNWWWTRLSPPDRATDVNEVVKRGCLGFLVI